MTSHYMRNVNRLLILVLEIYRWAGCPQNNQPGTFKQVTVRVRIRVKELLLKFIMLPNTVIQIYTYCLNSCVWDFLAGKV